MSGHTKGPWAYNERISALTGPNGERVRFYGDGMSFCMSDPSDEERANYRLIVAAPELLEALKEACDIMQREIPWNAEKKFRALIAKAEGK